MNEWFGLLRRRRIGRKVTARVTFYASPVRTAAIWLTVTIVGCASVESPRGDGTTPAHGPRSPASLSEATDSATALLDLRSESSPVAQALSNRGLTANACATTLRIQDALQANANDSMSAPMQRLAALPTAAPSVAGELLLPFVPAADDAPRASHFRRAAEFVCHAWQLDASLLPPPQGSVPVPGAQGAVYAMDFLLNTPRLLLEDALRDRPSIEEVESIARMLRVEISPSRESRAALQGATERLGTRLRGENGCMWAIARSLAHLDTNFGVTADWSTEEAEPVPPEIAAAIGGSVLTAQEVAGIGWVVVGGTGDNRYDMSRIAAVFDPAGNDRYVWGTLREGNQGIVDLAGNDRYEGSAEQGPAGAWRGISMVLDVDGNDAYSGGRLSGGSGWLGVGLLIDRAGDDVFDCGQWSLGAGLCGAGFLFDDAGRDVYFDRGFSQGLGGPVGIGLFVDSSGNDLHHSRGATRGADAVPGVPLGFSQGMAVGARRLLPGGIGALVDIGGDDRYEADEFSQGGGYWLGLGMMIDTEGNDLYRGSHYSQGFGCHQAAGALIDLGGDDTYWSTISAAQGAAWDEAIGVLVDAGGDDSYRGGALVQGAAAQSALAALVDFGGHDHFSAAGPFVQGESGPNTYNPDHRSARAFSVLLLGGMDAFTSAGPWTDNLVWQFPTSGSDAPLDTPMMGLRARGVMDLRGTTHTTSVRSAPLSR